LPLPFSRFAFKSFLVPMDFFTTFCYSLKKSSDYWR
jgi:hypothetical protein